MSKFNRGTTQAATNSPVTTEAKPTGRTHEGAPGYIRDAKSELFLLAVSNMVGEDTFYEKAGDRDERFRALVHQVAVEDGDWMARFLPWLRGEANMRSAPVVAALEAVRARLAAGLQGGNRELVASVLQRADEPGEALAYWTSRYGRAVPKPVKRGIADAVQRLYTERSLAKYDSDARGFRFGDVIDLVHPTPAGDKRLWQGDLFAHALDRRHGRDKPVPQSLRMLRDRAELLSIPVGERRDVLADPRRLAAAGITWEALAGWLQSPMDAQAWAAVIPSMGYMALLRNLRNFDEAGIGDELAGQIIAKLTNPEEVARSRQLPFRFYSAYRTAPSLRWGHALDTALTLATRNVPSFPGRTLVLVDTSASMSSGAVDGHAGPGRCAVRRHLGGARRPGGSRGLRRRHVPARDPAGSVGAARGRALLRTDRRGRPRHANRRRAAQVLEGARPSGDPLGHADHDGPLRERGHDRGPGACAAVRVQPGRIQGGGDADRLGQPP
ncbi:TROVE domain-containing protein [Microbispora sp. NBRC 16548]|uniref:TROVE domain-containing protein n=1 Tax=Microbispora sp. NBRC 16548 TaxID=3030994 RepID=UPI0024A205FD|nr:hypothetical protein Misp03_16640 [Microbispora sp. NBRC 16548]